MTPGTGHNSKPHNQPHTTMKLKKSEQEFYIVTWLETPNNSAYYRGPESPFLYWDEDEYASGYKTAKKYYRQNIFETVLEAANFVQELSKYPENSKIIVAKNIFTLATDSELEYLLKN